MASPAGGGYLGAALTYASGSGTLNDVDPGGSPAWPGTAEAPYGRLLVSFPDGPASWTGLEAGFDGQLLALVNLDAASNWTLLASDSGSAADNQFLAAGGGLILLPGGAVMAFYNAGSVNRWVIL